MNETQAAELMAELAQLRTESARWQDGEAERQWVSAVIQQAPAIMSVFRGPDLIVEFVSDLWRQTVGPREMLGKPYREAFPEFAEQGFADIFENIFRAGHTEVGHDVRADIDGEDGVRQERYFNYVWQPMRAPGGEIVGVITHSVEVTDAVLARKKIEAAERRVRDIVDSLDGVVWEFDLAEQRLTYLTESVEPIMGYSCEQLADGTLWAKIVPESDRQAHWQLADEAAACPDQAGFVHEYRLTVGDGSLRWLQDVVRLVRDDAGEVVSHRGITLDISEKKRAEEEQRNMQAKLLEVQKLESLGVLAGGIAHDFNNLLTGMLGNLSIALLDLPAGNPARPRLEAAMGGAQRAAELTQQMLAYSGRGTFTVEPVNVSAHLREIAGLFETTLPPGVQLRLDLDDDLPLVQADPSQLQQVFMNLVLNGAEAVGSERGTVHVNSGRQEIDAAYARRVLSPHPVPVGNYVFVEVSDSGCGMDAQTKAQIFDPFFTTKATGRGLGLAAVSGIIRSHDGVIRVYSSPGKGSTFKVLLPAIEGKLTAKPTFEINDIGHGDLVLVIDDEDDVRLAARFMLERLGFQVVEAVDGAEGLQTFCELADRLACVILDMTMPAMGGAEVFRRIQHITDTVPVVLSTGYARLEATHQFHGRGLAGFLQKPYTVQQLAEVMQATIGSEPAGA